MKTIKIIMMVLVPMFIGMTYQYAEAQNGCPGNKIRMATGLRGCGCNTCQKKCVAPADTASYLANGWYFGDCSKFCCYVNGFRLDEEISSTETSLEEIYPNPASGIVTIDFILSQQGEVTLEVFDMTGRYISTIAHDIFEEDGNQVTWDAGTINQGIYFIKMRAGSYSAVKRISVIK